jgi:CMP-N,N'-diacetyllegionaminic acid synthase
MNRKSLNIVGLIPARGGSKGVKRKNIRLLCGRPLLQYSLEVAKQSKLLTHIYCSTEDDEIKETCSNLNLALIHRPDSLSKDDTPSFDVIKHTVITLESKGIKPDYVVLLQPTYPFRSVEDIDIPIDIAINNCAESVVSISPVPKHFHPNWQLKISKEGDLGFFIGEKNNLSKIVVRRQDLEETFFRNGSVYVISYDTIMKKNSIYGDKTLPYIMRSETQINIDTEDDFQAAERHLELKKQISNKNE